MAKVIDYNGIQEFLLKIIDATVVDNTDYIIGVKDGKLVKTAYLG